MEWNNWEEKLTMERRLDDRGQVARKPSTETGIKDPRYNHCVALMHGNDGKNKPAGGEIATPFVRWLDRHS